MQGGRLIGATCGIIEEKNHGWALIRAWALNRDNMVADVMGHIFMSILTASRLPKSLQKATFGICSRPLAPKI